MFSKKPSATSPVASKPSNAKQASPITKKQTAPSIQKKQTLPPIPKNQTSPLAQNKVTSPAIQNKQTSPLVQKQVLKPASMNQIVSSPVPKQLLKPASLNQIISTPVQQQPIKSSKSKNNKYNDDEPISEHSFVKENTNSQNISSSEVKEALKLSLRLKRKIVQSSSFNEQTFPMLVSLQVEKLKTANKAPIDLVCVIDHSGSMQGEKIELVRNTFNYLLDYLGDSDRLSIVIFDDKVKRLTPLLRTTEANKQEILNKIKTVRDEGGTDINLGMREAFKILNDRRQSNPVSSIFLLSDGLDHGAQGRVQQSLNAYNIKDEVTIHTFGFGNDHDPKLMNDISTLRDGNFYFIEQLDTVDEAFVDCLGGLLSSIGQNVQIKIKPEQSEVLNGVEITKAYGDEAMWNRDGQTYITKLAALVSGRQKDFVLELKIPVNKKELQDQEKNIKVASAEADIVALDGQHIKLKADLYITLVNEMEEFKEEEEDDREVMRNFYRVKGALIMGEAKKLADQYKHEDAKKMLQNFKEELVNSFLKEEQFIQNLIKDIDQAIENVNPVVYERVGKCYMESNAKAQMYQKSNLTSANCYQNEMQERMIFETKSKKPSKK